MSETKKENSRVRRIKSDKIKMRTDENGMYIGDGSEHNDFYVIGFPGRNIKATVQRALTTESVYVRYENKDNGKTAIVRFSNHMCNGIKFGEYLNGWFPGQRLFEHHRLEVLYKLGLAEIVEVSEKPFVRIHKQTISNKNAKNKEILNLTIREIAALEHSTDFSQFIGKVVKEDKMHYELLNVELVTDAKRKILKEIL